MFNEFLSRILNYNDGSIRVKSGSGKEYEKSFEDGCLDIYHQSRTSEEEDFWLYANKWVDAGKSGRSGSVKIDIELVRRTVASSKGDVVTAHIHPLIENDKKLYPPSAVDMRMHAIDYHTDSKNKFRHIIFDGKGRWDMNMDESVKEEIIRNSNLLNYFESVVDEVNISLEADEIDRDEGIKRIIEGYRKMGVYLTYAKHIE